MPFNYTLSPCEWCPYSTVFAIRSFVIAAKLEHAAEKIFN